MKPSPIPTALLLALTVPGCAHQAPKPADLPDKDVGFDMDAERDTQPPRACAAATTQTAASDGHIATFTPSGNTLDFKGQIVAYPVGHPTAPTAATDGGTLRITLDAPVAEKAQFFGVILAFPACIDASAFTGVRFSIRGAYSGCSLQYATGDAAHTDRYTKAVFASGGRDSYAPQTMFEPGQVSTEAKTIRVPFVDPLIRGNPPLPIDKAALTQVLWQFTVSPRDYLEDGTTRCKADLTLDDVAFY